MAEKLSWEERLRQIIEPEKLGVIPALTLEWYQARRGRITASTRASVIANGRPKSWARLKESLELDLSPFWEHRDLKIEALDHGRHYEPEAIANASLAYGVEAYEPGLIIHPQHYYAGATPDFFLGTKVTCQIKCPLLIENHRKVLITKEVPKQYYHQINFEAWVSGRPKILFMSYHAGEREDKQCAFIELEANKTLWALYEENLLAFKRMFEENVVPVKQLKGLAPVGIPTLF